MRGLGKGVSGKPYPRLCNARRPRLETGTFRSQAVRLYRLHQTRPSYFVWTRKGKMDALHADFKKITGIMFREEQRVLQLAERILCI